jgi:tryptophan-rich sensory protein
MLSPTLLGVIICVTAAILEGTLAGKGARQRLAQLRMPPYSPPFALWLVIGAAYYAICFTVLRYLLGTVSSPTVIASLCLLSVVLLANALWSVFFFRWRDLRVSFLAFIPYALVIVALVTLLVPTYPFGAALFLCYGCYLVYATWWGYRLWRLNDPRT